MEKVWEELKKIEADGQKIRSDAQDKASAMTAVTQQNIEKLIANSQNYAEEEGQQLYTSTVEEANRNREEQLKAHQIATETLKEHARKRMDLAINKVVDEITKEAQA